MIWSSHAWTLQEKISSSRVFYFSAQKCFFMYHHCQVSFLKNDNIIKNDLERIEWSENFSNVNINLISTTHIVNIIVYRQVVQAYTFYHLIFFSNILLIFKVLEAHFHSFFCIDFLFNLSCFKLDFQLLWQFDDSFKWWRDLRMNFLNFFIWS